MSNSAAATVTTMPRRALSDRQARTVDGLTEAAVDELAAAGYGGLTVRNVAKRAGVAPATAYNYFASKEHLVAEVFWRRFRAQPEPEAADDRPPAAKVRDALGAFALLVADEAELSAACTVAVLADDPDVRVLRERIGGELHRRLVAALGAGADPALVQTLQFATSGALLQVGTGHLSYGELPEVLDRITTVVLGDR
jgi:AcrR family transcriptional regulator